MMNTIDLDDNIHEQQFIDININDNENDLTNVGVLPLKTSPKNSIFNFRTNAQKFTNNDSKKKPLKQTKSGTCKNTKTSPNKVTLSKSMSQPISSQQTQSTRSNSKQTQSINQPLTKLNEIDINSSELSDDDDDDTDILVNFNDQKLMELNKNVMNLKKNYLQSVSSSSLKEGEIIKEREHRISDYLSHNEQSTPKRSASLESENVFNDSKAVDFDKTINSMSDNSNDHTLSFNDDNQEAKDDISDISQSDRNSSELRVMLGNRNDSIVDNLLGDIYDRFNVSLKDSFNESDAFTDLTMSSSNLTENNKWAIDDSDMTESNSNIRYGKSYHSIKLSIQRLDVESLRYLVNELTLKSNQTSTKLIKHLRQKDKLLAKLDKNCDILTSILQARSLKRRVDTQMKFTIDPMPGEAGFIQWKDAMKALVRLPGGVPKEFRKSVWLNLSKQYIKDINLDWNKVRRIAFNDRSNPDDHELGIQIVKDLHRTGCSNVDNEQDRALLKRVLLAFARYNKSVGYCQGFNIIAAQILEIVDKKEEDALMCMIYLIDHILPEGYFTNSMHSLAIDMAVFRELLKRRLPRLCQHLNDLQFNSVSDTTTSLSIFSIKKKKNNPSCSNPSTYEPPLTNVFTMQWFLTLFATCLPKNVLLRVWDCLFLEGAEILFRTSIAIWDKLSVSVMKANSADSFYSMMSVLTVKLFDRNAINEHELINKIYSYGPLPLSGLEEMREKLTFNITPFQQNKSSSSNSINNDNSKNSVKSRSNSIGLSHLKLNNQSSSGNNSLISDLDSSNLTNNDLELSLRKIEQNDKSKSFYYENHDDEVEDLAKMISCFSLLMPNSRSIGSGHNEPQTSSSTRNDIIIHAAAAASAYGPKLTNNKSFKNHKSKNSKNSTTKINDKDDVSSVTPGAFSMNSNHLMYNPKPSGDNLTSDLNELKKQYKKLKERQMQAHVIVQTASDKHRKNLLSKKSSVTSPDFQMGFSRNSSMSNNENISRTSLKNNILDFDLTPNLFRSDEANKSTIVNHLLIKPNDLNTNTVKKSITLVNHPDRTVTDSPSDINESYIDIKKKLNSHNIECLNYEKNQSKKKKLTEKKPYFSDDDSDTSDDIDNDLEDDKMNEISMDMKNKKTSEIFENDKDLVSNNPRSRMNAGKSLRGSQSSSSSDDCFYKENSSENNDKSNKIDKNSDSKLKPKIVKDSKLIMKHLANEEKRQMTTFNPFPARNINPNVTKNGMRLGLYKC